MRAYWFRPCIVEAEVPQLQARRGLGRVYARMRPSWILIFLFWATALFLSAQARPSVGDYSGEFRASLEEERRLSMLLRLESGCISTRLAFGASAEGFSIASSVDASGSDSGGLGWGARFLAGPGSPSGTLAVLSAPTAYASGLSARGFPLRLDPSLAASTSVLGLGVDLGLGRLEGSLALFGAASGLEGGLPLRQSGPHRRRRRLDRGGARPARGPGDRLGVLPQGFFTVSSFLA